MSKKENNQATPRRSFLKDFAGSAVAVSVFPATGSANALLSAINRLGAADTASEPFWRLVKGQVTVKPKLILLNDVDLGLSPDMVRDMRFRLTEDIDRDMSFQNRGQFNAV